MTFSILAFDEKTCTYGGAAATGSLCVGGWVLRGDPESGLSASQGTSPSTLWGENALIRMKAGLPAVSAIEEITSADPGAAHRQLSAIDPTGRTGSFTGQESVPYCGVRSDKNVVVAGNMLAGPGVLDAALHSFLSTGGAIAIRLLSALKAGQSAGSDSRGLQSAALLVVSRGAAPLTLRIDQSDDPLAALEALYTHSQSDPYRGWTDQVPTLDDPYRCP